MLNKLGLLGIICGILFLTAPGVAMAASSPISIDDCQKLSPVAMAERSEVVKKSFDYLTKISVTISDAKLRGAVSEYLKNPVPSLMALYPSDVEKEAVKQKLVIGGYIKADAAYNQFLPVANSNAKSPQPFYSAPGSGYMSHHSYPGGLATHVAVNVKVALSIYEAYKDVYSTSMNRDVILASELMHDMNKPWVFQWQEDGASFTEYGVAGQGAHHVLSIAEAMYRGFPKEVVVAIACAHTHPGTLKDEKDVVSWLKAAAIIAGKDPVEIGVLGSDGQTLPIPRWMEGFVTHLGDHDFVLTVPMAKWLIAEMGEIARKEYSMTEADLTSKKFNAFRNYVFSQVTIERLYYIWVNQGEAALVDAVKAVVAK
ncbi:MAG: metal-dependent phosphohydrolase [Negativicutes bacterium]